MEQRRKADLPRCIASLDRQVARYVLLPDRRFGGACRAIGAVQLRDIGTPVSNLGAMTCQLAEGFAGWVQSDVQAIARRTHGQGVRRVATMGSYACRPVNGVPGGRLSEHAYANAVDVSGFTLDDGRVISVATGWQGDERDARLLREVRSAACRRFGTVLSPDYNAAHRDHLHFDLGPGRVCR